MSQVIRQQKYNVRYVAECCSHGIGGLAVEVFRIREVEVANFEGETLLGYRVDGVDSLKIFADTAALGVDCSLLCFSFVSEIWNFGKRCLHRCFFPFPPVKVIAHQLPSDIQRISPLLSLLCCFLDLFSNSRFGVFDRLQSIFCFCNLILILQCLLVGLQEVLEIRS